MKILYGTLLNAATGAGLGSSVGPNANAGTITFQAVHTVTATAPCSSTVRIEAHNAPGNFPPAVTDPWVILGTISLSGSTAVTDGFVSNAPWRWLRANVLNASGAATAISVYTGQSIT